MAPPPSPPNLLGKRSVILSRLLDCKRPAKQRSSAESRASLRNAAGRWVEVSLRDDTLAQPGSIGASTDARRGLAAQLAFHDCGVVGRLGLHGSGNARCL